MRLTDRGGDATLEEDVIVVQHLRIARATDQLDALVSFYCDVLGFRVIGSFSHNGYDGAMVGDPSQPYHFEFTHEHGTRLDETPSPEHLIVLYLEDADWHAMREQIRDRAVPVVPSHNPYWDQHGITIVDPDGFRIVLHRGAWRPAR